MAFHYFERMINIFKHFLDRKEVSSSLPNELIVEILSRLPADTIPTCRKVSRIWEILTSTPRFTLLHAINAPSIIFLQYFSSGMQRSYFLDTKEEKKKMIEEIYFNTNLPPAPMYKLIGCCHGLLLFGGFPWTGFFYICNPVMPGRYRLREPHKRGYVFGIYFHPLTKDYRVLYLCDDTECLVSSLHALQWEKLCTFTHRPEREVAPISINGLMHWMVEHAAVIMTFTIETEEFSVRPQPESISLCHSHLMPERQLLHIGSRLAFCHLCCAKIGVWVLEDYANWVWVNRYLVRLEWNLKRYPFNPVQAINDDIKVVTIENGELVLFWGHRGLFRYHLQLKTVKRIPSEQSRMNVQSTKSLFVTSYTKSFVTLGLRNLTFDCDIEKFRELYL